MKHHKHEYDTWLRTLEVIQLDIVALKIRIAEIVRHDVSASALEHLEYFQNKFLNKDAVIAELRRDIKQQYLRFADQNEIGTGCFGDMLTKQQNKLQENVAELGKELSYLKSEFNNYFKVPGQS